jgi:hypothetical protein
MSIAISQANNTSAVVQPTASSSQKTAQPEKQPTTITDTVHLSAAAQAASAAIQETRETPSQTAQEAGKGDLQAKKLLAKEAAAKPAAK